MNLIFHDHVCFRTKKDLRGFESRNVRFIPKKFRYEPREIFYKKNIEKNLFFYKKIQIIQNILI